MSDDRLVRVESGEIWTTREGRGLPILLASGGPGRCDYMAPIAKLLTGLGQIVRFDQRGCGRSSAARRYSVAQCVDDLEKLRLSCAAERVLIVGHGWGVNLGLAFALERPRHLLGLVGIAGGRIVDDRQWSHAYHGKKARLGEVELEWAFPMNPEVNRSLKDDWRRYCKAPKLLARLGGLAMPALFVTGSEDIRPNWPTEQLAELLPMGRHVSIQGAGHVIWATHERELREMLRDFVRPFGGRHRALRSA